MPKDAPRNAHANWPESFAMAEPQRVHIVVLDLTSPPRKDGSLRTSRFPELDQIGISTHLFVVFDVSLMYARDVPFTMNSVCGARFRRLPGVAQQGGRAGPRRVEKMEPRCTPAATTTDPNKKL